MLTNPIWVVKTRVFATGRSDPSYRGLWSESPSHSDMCYRVPSLYRVPTRPSADDQVRSRRYILEKEYEDYTKDLYLPSWEYPMDPYNSQRMKRSKDSGRISRRKCTSPKGGNGRLKMRSWSVPTGPLPLNQIHILRHSFALEVLMSRPTPSTFSLQDPQNSSP